ncbi:hypothetical protein [Hyphomicrobium sp.]|uniref:hypothetical protein n=1 Tax=Hyphomicrobium sp. TaxID=82 RepID=UPI002E33ED5C|nr:hypothetical protein [Hyphomicrobium sp.]HEX2843154.1 hypothetical protein [Hyphomicrobium sp.]
MTPISTLLAARAAFAAAVALGTLAASTQAGAVSLSVKMACASDYYAHCSQHAPDSPGVRKCMRAVGRNLSQGCINALVAAGEVSKSVVEKQVAAK